ncbi:cytochrome P450 [Aspergillus carlsbadensis]|nr:cytochrome P450 [Aspergillus carlsbadensis]
MFLRLLACGLAVALALAGGLHLLYNHSRVKFVPGPFFAAISDLWRIYAQKAPGYSRHLVKLHQKHGDAVRLGPSFVSIRDYEEIARVYSERLREELSESGQSTSHEQLRGRPEDLTHHEGAINDDLRNIIGTFRRHRTVDLTASLRFFTEGFLSRFVVGNFSRLTPGDPPDNRPPSSILSILEEQLLRGPASLLKRERLSCYNFGRKASIPLAQRISGTIDASIHRKHDEPPILAACIDSIATTFVTVFHILLSKPIALSTLRSELDSVPRLWNKSVIPSWRDLAGLPYLDAVLNETMRHALLIDYQHGVRLAEGPLEMSCIRIPRGTTVSWYPFVVLCNDTVYGEDADEFRPERWLSATHQHLMSMHKSLVPFSVCLAEYPKLETAWLELKKAAVVLLREFDFQVVETQFADGPEAIPPRYPPTVLVRCIPRIPGSGRGHFGHL